MQAPVDFCGLTITVYPPPSETSQGASVQTRRINLVGLKRRSEDGRVGDKGGLQGLRTGACANYDGRFAPCVVICAIDFASIARPNECAARRRAIQARPYWQRAQTTPARVKWP